MGSCVVPHTFVVDPFVAEARACESAILFAMDLGFCHVPIEGDSLTVIKKLRFAVVDRSVLGPIVHDILVNKGYFSDLI